MESAVVTAQDKGTLVADADGEASHGLLLDLRMVQASCGAWAREKRLGCTATSFSRQSPSCPNCVICIASFEAAGRPFEAIRIAVWSLTKCIT